MFYPRSSMVERRLYIPRKPQIRARLQVQVLPRVPSLDRWESGLIRRFAKPEYSKGYREFESRPVRHVCLGSCLSGLRSTLGKRVQSQGCREFESHRPRGVVKTALQLALKASAARKGCPGSTPGCSSSLDGLVHWKVRPSRKRLGVSKPLASSTPAPSASLGCVS